MACNRALLFRFRLMTAHLYTTDERRQQLLQLEQALENLMPVVRRLKLDQLHAYEEALDKARLLLAYGFEPSELAALGCSVQDAFPRYRDWQTPHLVKQADGVWRLPDWLEELELYLRPVLKSASDLRSLGFYLEMHLTDTA